MKWNYNLLLAGLFIIAVASCQEGIYDDEDTLVPTYETPVAKAFTTTTECGKVLQGVSMNGQKTLVFSSIEHLQAVMACLNEQLDSHNASFDQQIEASRESSVEDEYDRYGFDEERPLVDFERRFSGFTSLRAQTEEANLAWEAAEKQSFSELPEYQTVLDHTLRTVLGENCEVVIGKEIVNFCEDKNKVLDRCNRLGCCKFGLHFEAQFVSDNEAVVKGLYFNGGIWSHVSSSVTSYQRNSRGRWRRTRNRKTAEFNIYLRNNSCIVTLFDRDDKSRNRRTVSVGHTFFAKGSRIGPRDVFGEYWFLGTSGVLDLI